MPSVQETLVLCVYARVRLCASYIFQRKGVKLGRSRILQNAGNKTLLLACVAFFYKIGSNFGYFNYLWTNREIICRYLLFRLHQLEFLRQIDALCIFVL